MKPSRQRRTVVVRQDRRVVYDLLTRGRDLGRDIVVLALILASIRGVRRVNDLRIFLTAAALSMVLLAAPAQAMAQTSVPVCERTGMVTVAITKQALGLSEYGPNDCQRVRSSHMNALEELFILGNFYHGTGQTHPRIRLKTEDLSGLPNLKRLEIKRHGQLASLPAGIFSGLTSLSHLDLSGNNLELLPSNIFSELPNLEWLTLDSNLLTSLPSTVFSGLTSLSHLNLYSNPLTSLPADVFSGLTSLSHLYLSKNRTDPLPITVSLVSGGEGEFKATVHTGAPFRIVLPVSLTNGTIDGGASSITIPTGSVESNVLSVSRSPGTTSAVTVDIGELPRPPRGDENRRASHDGYTLVKSDALPLTLVVPQALTVMLEMPDNAMDGNLVEGSSYDIKVSANQAVTEDTEVMIKRDRAESDAGEDDFSVGSAVIMAGEDSATAALMVTADDLPDGGTNDNMGEALVLYGRVNGKATNSLMFTIWDVAVPVPALPIIGQLALALFLLTGGAGLYRRRLRSA